MTKLAFVKIQIIQIQLPFSFPHRQNCFFFCQALNTFLFICSFLMWKQIKRNCDLLYIVPYLSVCLRGFVSFAITEAKRQFNQACNTCNGINIIPRLVTQRKYNHVVKQTSLKKEQWTCSRIQWKKHFWNLPYRLHCISCSVSWSAKLRHMKTYRSS